MALVGYSDSEGSDNEAPAAAPVAAKPAARALKPGFQKVIDPSAPRKIKVELPTVKPDVKEEEEERPAKKARTGGLSGFNSFLPAPKRTADKKPGLGSGVNLRTGAEPAFSRKRVEPDFPPPTQHKDGNTEAKDGAAADSAPTEEEKPKEVKIVGNVMRFKPLSVANKKQKKKPINLPPKPESSAPTQPQSTTKAAAQAPIAPLPKKKVSLFSVTQEEEAPEALSVAASSSEYQPILTDTTPVGVTDELPDAETYAAQPTYTNSNPLDAIAEDLNLSASARRQLFGRNKDASAGARIMHFDMDQEYASNEVLRQQGQAQEHRAVKAIAPGKHSLQQLVNAASTQKEALEDKWAEGKRNKAEGGSKYGW